MFNFGFLNNLFGGGNVLGVDIGTASIKMVELAKSGEAWSLENYGILENYGHFDRLNEVIQTSTMKIFDKEAVRLLKLLKDQLGIRAKNAVASLPVFAAFTTLIEMPDMADEEVNKTIVFKAKQYIPMPMSEVTLDWMPVGYRESGEGKNLRQILLISVPTERIKKYKDIFKEAGLNLLALEVESLSNVRSLVAGDATPTLIVDIGSHSTGIIAAQDGFLKVSNQIDYAGSQLTYALAKGLNINLRRAEELKKQRGLLGTGGEFELSTIMFPFVDVIINEVIRVKNNYEGEYGAKIERIILTGGGANLLGLLQYLEKQTGMTVLRAHSLMGFKYDQELEPIRGDLEATLSVAVGLGMRNQ